MEKKKYLLVIIIGLIFGLVWFFIYDNQEVYKGSRVKNPDSYEMEFSEMNQLDFHELVLHKGDILEVSFTITKGDVSLTIGMDTKEYIYKGNKIDNGSFELVITEGGAYKITVDSKHAKGVITIKKKSF